MQKKKIIRYMKDLYSTLEVEHLLNTFKDGSLKMVIYRLLTVLAALCF